MRNDLTSILDSFRPYTVGFQDMFKRLEEFKLPQVQSMYPPFNVVKKDDNHYVVELAVAGFGQNDLDIAMENGNLTISGKVQSDTSEQDENYIFKGIATRQFSRAFSLADTVEIKGAELVNGMLKVYLENIVAFNKLARKIPITNGKAVSEPQLLNEGKASKKAA